MQPITRVIIHWFNGNERSYRYRIDVSDDDSGYTTVADRTGRTETGDSTDTFSASGRYVRVTVTGVSPGGWADFFEVRVFDDTVATGLAELEQPRIHLRPGQDNEREVSVSIPSHAGLSYQLQHSENLIPGNWTDVGPARQGDGEVIDFLEAYDKNADRAFYRVEIRRADP